MSEDEPAPEPSESTSETGVPAPPFKTEEQRIAEIQARTAPYRWKPGQSGNPGGRPKKLTDGYSQMIDMKITRRFARAHKLPQMTVGLTMRQAIAQGIGAAAIRGQTEAAREIADRLEGKVESSVRLQTESSFEEIIGRLWIKKMGNTPPPTIDAVVVPEVEEGSDNGDGGTED